jgi:hypothetical protein
MTARKKRKCALELLLLTHRIPLRPDYDVDFTLPRDLTKAEAEHIVRIIRSLAR